MIGCYFVRLCVFILCWPWYVKFCLLSFFVGLIGMVTSACLLLIFSFRWSPGDTAVVPSPTGNLTVDLLVMHWSCTLAFVSLLCLDIVSWLLILLSCSSFVGKISTNFSIALLYFAPYSRNNFPFVGWFSFCINIW